MLDSNRLVACYLAPRISDSDLSKFNEDRLRLVRVLGETVDEFWTFLMQASVSPTLFLPLQDVFVSMFFLRGHRDIPGKVMSFIFSMQTSNCIYLDKSISEIIELIIKAYHEKFNLFEKLLDANKEDTYNIIDMLLGWDQLGTEATQIIWQLTDQYGFAQTGWMLAWHGNGRGVIERRNGNGFVLVMTHNQPEAAPSEA